MKVVRIALDGPAAKAHTNPYHGHACEFVQLKGLTNNSFRFRFVLNKLSVQPSRCIYPDIYRKKNYLQDSHNRIAIAIMRVDI